MSRDILDEMLGEAPEQREHYEPGCPEHDCGLVEEIIQTVLFDEVKDTYLSASVYHNMIDLFDRLVDKCTSILEPVVTTEFHHNLFLDHVVSELSQKASSAQLAKMSTLFSPLIQTLYNLGGNNFFLDTSPIGKMPYTMMCYIKGKDDEPLSLTYKGDTHCFGDYTKHCRFIIFGKVESHAATRAKHSVFRLQEMDGVVGEFANSCRFYVPSQKNVPYRTPLSAECDYYLAKPLGESEQEWLDNLRCTEFLDGWKNSLYVPDEDGEWKEVTP